MTTGATVGAYTLLGLLYVHYAVTPSKLLILCIGLAYIGIAIYVGLMGRRRPQQHN